MGDGDNIEWRLERAEVDLTDIKKRVTDTLENGRFIRRELYMADQRAQERTDLEQERRFAELRDALTADIDRIDASAQWLQRQLIVMLLGIVSVAVIAALAIRAVS